MQCPNCGRNVRSKTQCAYCGYKFNQADKKEQGNLDKKTQNTFKKSEDHPNSGKKTNQKQNLSNYKPEVTRHVPVRRSLEKELAEAEKEAKLAYERSIVGVSNSSSEEDDSEDAFKRRADEVLSYPYTSSEFLNESHAEEDDYIVPKTKKNHFGKLLWNLLKWLIVLAVFFLIFLYGPQLLGMVKSYLDPMIGQNNEQPVQEVVTSQDQNSSAEIETTTKTESDENSSKEAGLKEEQTTSHEVAAFQIKDKQVDVEEYPTIKIDLEFVNSLSQVNQETFKFKVKYNDTEVELKDEFSLFKEGKMLKISFNDPALSVIGEDTSQQALLISADNFSEKIAYKVPDKQDQAERIDQFNQTVNEYFPEQETVALQIQKVGDQAPFVYEDQTMEADRLIAWFILQRTYELVADGIVSLDEEIPVKTQLIASGDVGQVASQERDSYTVQELIDLTIQAGDASAMNHLVQLAEGVNRFNYWLKESGYFATRMNAPLAIEEEAYITGSVTNVTDLSNLLSKLAKNQLVDEEHDNLLKEAVNLSPYTDKFPNYNALVTQRYELLTTEENPQLQHIAGIAQAEGSEYIYVVLTKKFNESYDMVGRISQTLNDLMTQLITGEEVQETTIEESSVEVGPAEAGVEPTDNLYNGKQTENYYWFGDEYRRGTWYQDEKGTWYFY
ncbi:serine hydrolase [Facklamia miroungae]|uniref:Beta-lactamase enzyme family protein n=1 Tax=Facklamia miroungae TaxID=120956 RepID=A0A1G7TGM6_9LACT|nr:serine hydrolase [Facklamia miroungae]NKZ29848.1 serine hydrolase [Facklamia miroungae]SDG34252.1 Beta-lactamase enzyme family protein [Facklamia miroungae]